MGVRILSVDGNGDTCLYDSVTGWAFGPVASEDELDNFLVWCEEKQVPDLRRLPSGKLEDLWAEYVSGASADKS